MISGAQPEIFQGRGGFVESRHFDKYFVKKYKKKRPRREKFGSFSPRYSKNYTLNRNFNSKMNKIRAIFFQIRALFSIFKKGQGSPPPLPLVARLDMSYMK